MSLHYLHFVALIEPYETRFKAITWSNDENLLYAGDEAGYILTLDKRVPKQYLHKQRYFNRSIRKLSVQGLDERDFIS